MVRRGSWVQVPLRALSEAPAPAGRSGRGSVASGARDAEQVEYAPTVGGHGPGDGGWASHRRGLLLLVASLAALLIASVAAWQVKAVDVPFVGENQDSLATIDKATTFAPSSVAPHPVSTS